jgi:hypothetical protein
MGTTLTTLWIAHAISSMTPPQAFSAGVVVGLISLAMFASLIRH